MPVNEIQHALSTHFILCQENADPSQEPLARNPEITGLTEITVPYWLPRDF